MLGVGVSILSTLPSIVSTTQIPASVALQEGTGEQRWSVMVLVWALC